MMDDDDDDDDDDVLHITLLDLGLNTPSGSWATAHRPPVSIKISLVLYLPPAIFDVYPLNIHTARQLAS